MFEAKVMVFCTIETKCQNWNMVQELKDQLMNITIWQSFEFNMVNILNHIYGLLLLDC